MAIEKQKDVIQLYMSKLDPSKFLSKEEEQDISKKIQDTTDAIFEACLPYPVFRDQLYKLKASIARNDNKMSKVLKNFEEDASPEEYETFHKRFDRLFKAIEDEKPIAFHMRGLNFTNSTIVTMTSPIKKLYREYTDIEENIKRGYKFLEIDSKAKYEQLVERCMENKSYLNKVSRELYCTPDVVLKHIRSVEDGLRRIEEMDFSGEFKDIKEIYNKITSLESDVEHLRNRLIEANLALVINRAKRFMKCNIDFEDLIQEGNIGLIKAVDKFEYTKGFRLTTYATWWIDQAIRRAISNKEKLVRIPIHIQDRLQKINTSYFKLCQENKGEPSYAQISADTGIDVEEVTRIMTSALHEVGLETQISEGVSINDVLQSEEVSPQAAASAIIFQEKLRSVLALLKPKYEKVIRLRFGIGEVNDHTLEEIGQYLGLTKERIRQIEKKALGQLAQKDKLKDGI